MPLIAATSGFDYHTGTGAAVEASGKQSGGPANTGVCDMQYDRLGFPIPSDFEPAVPRGRRGSTRLASDPRDRFADAEQSAVPDRGRAAGPLKRFVLLAALGLVVVPALVLPFVGPLAREAVVQWSLERAAVREARHRTACAPSCLLGNDLRDGFALGTGHHRRVQVGDSSLDPLFPAFVDRERSTERLVGDRIMASPHQELELVF